MDRPIVARSAGVAKKKRRCPASSGPARVGMGEGQPFQETLIVKPYLRSSLVLIGAFFAGTSVSHAFMLAPPDTQEYFLIQSASSVNGSLRVTGQFIRNASVEVEPSYQDPGDAPRIRFEPLRPFEVKWILGPNGEGKEFAEAAGYETVAHDDFSYPPPRT